MSAIPTWVYTATTLVLLFTTATVAYRTQGGVKKPFHLLFLTLVTIIFVFALPFIQSVTPQLGLDLRGGVSVVLEAKGNPGHDQIELAAGVIRDRVDALGVAEPDIRVEGKNVVVDLPGAKDARKAQELIGKTAELRFREVAAELGNATAPGTQEQQAILQQVYLGLNPAKSTTTTTTAKSKSTSTSSSSSTTAAEQSEQSWGGPGKSRRSETTTTSSSTTTTIPVATQSVTLSCGGTNPVDVVLTGDLTKPTPREEDLADKAIIAVGENGLPSILCPAVLKGDIVKTASKQVDSTGQVSVGVELTGKGASDFTSKIGAPLSGKLVAIVLDSKVISAPQINADLADGLPNNQLRIEIGDTKNQTSEVDELVTVLKFGRLPVVLTQQTAQKVSPTLGADQLHAGLIAGAIGIALVIIYMLLYYRILALVVVGGITLSGMSVYALVCWLGDSQGLSLTLAGAVGLIVSLGVTVDSYVVYFERLKDEVRQGRSLRSCLDPAFKASFRTILAADLVSLLGAAVLFQLASGSVRGFAFFLGLSTLLDLLVSLCFMHPFVKVLAQRDSFVTNRIFGIGAALDKKDLTL